MIPETARPNFIRLLGFDPWRMTPAAALDRIERAIRAERSAMRVYRFTRPDRLARLVALLRVRSEITQ